MKWKSIYVICLFLGISNFGFTQTQPSLDPVPKYHIDIYIHGNVWSQTSQNIRSVLDEHQFNQSTQGSFLSSNTYKHPRSKSRIGWNVDVDVKLRKKWYLGGIFGVSNNIEDRGVHLNNGHVYIDHINYSFSPIARLYNKDHRLNVFAGPSLNYLKLEQNDAWMANDEKLFSNTSWKPGIVIGGQFIFAPHKTIHLGIKTQLLITPGEMIGPIYNRSDEISIPEFEIGTSHLSAGVTIGVNIN